MKRMLLALCLLGTLTNGEAAPLPAPPSAPSPSSAGLADARRSTFAGDARLEAPLTARYGDRPLGETLAALGRDLKVPLRAERDVADDRATLFVKARPASDCLQRLAEQFRFQWRRRGKGYELWQDSASRRREASLRERDLAVQLKALETQMEAVEDAEPRAADSATRARELLRALASAPSLSPAERKQRFAEWNRLRRESAGPVAVAVYQSLTVAQIRRLTETGELFLSNADGSLLPALSERVNRLAVDLSTEPPIEPPRQAHVDIRLDEGPIELAKPPPDPTPRLSLRFTLTSLRRLEKTPDGQAVK